MTKIKQKGKWYDLSGHPLVASLLSNVAVLGALGGSVWALGDRPPWAGIQRVSNIEQANMLTRYSQVLEAITKLKNKKRTSEEQQWYNSLLLEQKILACQLKLEKC